MLVLIINGRPQKLEKACPHSIPCPFEKVKQTYPVTWSNNCDREFICRYDEEKQQALFEFGSIGKQKAEVSNNSLASTSLTTNNLTFMLIAILITMLH